MNFTDEDFEVSNEYLNDSEILAMIDEIDTIEVACPSCKRIGKVKLSEQSMSAEAICQTCGNIYEVIKPKY